MTHYAGWGELKPTHYYDTVQVMANAFSTSLPLLIRQLWRRCCWNQRQWNGVRLLLSYKAETQTTFHFTSTAFTHRLSWSKHSDNSYEELPVFLRQHAMFLMLCKKNFSKEFVRIGSNPTYIRSKAIDKKSMRPGKSLASVLCLLLSALTLLVRWEEHLARKIPVQRYTVWNKWRTEILAANDHKDRGWYFYRTKRPHHCTEVRNAVVISQKLV